jgi:hypothetical protein
MSKNYALLKDNVVVNVVVFDDDATPELMQIIAEDNNATHFLSCEEYGFTTIGGTFDGTRLWTHQPFPSWIKNEEFYAWQAPVPYPEIENGSDEFYVWDENTISWLLLPPA